MILILGGTTEGRLAAKVADQTGKTFYYSTRGERQQVDTRNGIQVTGAKDFGELTEFCRSNGIRLLIDAAHPFAVRLHDTVEKVSSMLGVPVIRVERVYPPRTDDVIWCDGYDDAVERLLGDGIESLLALTGVQTIGKLKRYWMNNRCWFRILDREESVKSAVDQGFDSDNLVFYHNDEPEESLMRELKPQAVLTKESGLSGGFVGKVSAAASLGIPVYAVKRPELPSSFITVTGEHGLRKQIERLLPGCFPLRSGYTTGACATAAARAALLALITGEEQSDVSFSIPDGEVMTLPVSRTIVGKDSATASVVKDAGDDPDVTDGCTVSVSVTLSKTPGIHFLQGCGVGRVTLPGLGIEPGEPAINPIPRKMITEALTTIYDGGLDVTVSVPHGEELAQRTFNPKLGIVGGISIIGTSGIVIPFSSEAFVEAIRREVEVCVAVGASRLVINSGARSERFVKAVYPDLPPQAFVHYGNYIGETLRIAADLKIRQVTMGVMIGKAVKLAEGSLDTHSKLGTMNIDFVCSLVRQSSCPERVVAAARDITLARDLWNIVPPEYLESFSKTVLSHCHSHCDPLLPDGTLTILLIDEEGRIY